ncbi:glucose 1-dehydrogenase [Rhodococcus sp. NCIMB 12038]|uniref:glucose 1-dehydrogenase n=2 Tax=Rhodococcus sp. NCIMB 12038 TaxID=933800 RepID=UPI000B3CB575|nr:glucose 1-dehydrogenase [Rhodococcus sp. NCIMB 12038]OUS95088.1 3-alpha-hydroxysteroid dehydrogenase [Rhodococcus sp. NCIMB 12038]
MTENPAQRVDGKIAVITGGAQGMGAAHVRLLAEHGARVVIADLDDGAGQVLAKELGADALFLHLDVTDPDQWTSLVQETETHFGTIDVLINNAGILLPHDTLETDTLAQYRKVIDINQVGTFLGMQATVPGMKQNGGGSIVNISSTAGLVAFTDNFAYTASKWAVRGMTKAAALELAPHKIRVNAILPGEVNTPMIADLDLDVTTTPLGRFGEPHEIAYLALYLASNEASYTTGADHVIDGGYTVP